MMSLPPSPPPVFRRPRPRVALWLPGALLLVLVGLRALLPGLLERFVRSQLASLPDYRGSLGEVDVSLLRGDLSFHELNLYPAEGPERETLSIRTLRVSFRWRDLLRGRLATELRVESPVLLLAAPAPNDASDGEQQDEPPFIWASFVDSLPPVKIRSLVVSDGSIVYSLAALETPLPRLGLHHVALRLENLGKNPDSPSPTPPTTAILSAAVTGGGLIVAEAEGHLLLDHPRITATAEVKDLWLPTYNPFCRDALGVDLTAGRLQIAAELHIEDGAYEGYLKPLVRDAVFTRVDQGPGDVLARAREVVFQAVTTLLSNNQTGDAGARVPFNGRFDHTDVEAWPAFVSLLRNAFVRALGAGLDGG